MKLNYDYLRACLFAASGDMTRSYLCGVYVKAEGTQVNYAATDGHKLILIEEQQDADNKKCEFIIPSNVVRMLPTLLPESRKRWKSGLIGKQVYVTVDGCNLEFKAVMEGSATFGSVNAKAIDATYPDYMRVIPTEEKMNDAKWETGPFTFAMNYSLMHDIMRAVLVFKGKRGNSCGVKTMAFAADAPFLCKDTDFTSKFTAVVMPMLL